MAKKLKLRAKLSVDGKTCTIEVVEQSHTSLNFGGNYHGAGAFIHNNVRLISYIQPMVPKRPSYETEIHVYVKGSSNIVGNKIYDVPANLWPEIKAAVEAYNEYYSDEKIREREEAKKSQAAELAKWRKNAWAAASNITYTYEPSRWISFDEYYK